MIDKRIITKQPIAGGVVHEVPVDIRKILLADRNLLAIWNTRTSIQRNEWICWVTIVKKKETRAEHLERMQKELREGKHTPCCWPGCPHRRESAKKNGLSSNIQSQM